MQNNDEKMTQFLQYLESSGRFRKMFLWKVCISIYFGSNSLEKPIKEPILTTLDKKNLRKPPKNDGNYQISIIFGISRHILGKHFA